MDQIIAKQLGKETQLASLELGLFSGELVGLCDGAVSCAYFTTLSWSTPTTPLPIENNPRALFERMFGDVDSTDRAKQLARMQKQRSILDGVAEGASRFLNEVGTGDRAKLTEYLDAIRDIERRIQIAEGQPNREMPTFDRPAGVPEKYDDYAKLMFDLQVLAYQSDLTRVITFMMAREGLNGSCAYPELGIPDLHHTLSHHQNNPAAIEKLFQINVYHTKLVGHFLEKLRGTPDGEGTLLDHSIILYGSGLSDGNVHQHTNLPLLLAGGAGAGIKSGRHIRYSDGTPMTNLHLNREGVRIFCFVSIF